MESIGGMLGLRTGVPVATWRLTSHGETVLANWRKNATRADQESMAEVLETITNGTWRDMWWSHPYPTDSETIEIRPRDGLHILARGWIDEDETDDVIWVDLVTIATSGEERTS
jgi:hypothetical protein